MQNFTDWLDSNPGMATRLTKKLGINPTNVSNWRNGRKPIPWKHMADIAALSRGKVKFKDLFAGRSKTPA